MLLNPGAKLGPYEVLSLLGSGGMGEVYRARDTKLGREVALKVLPEAFAKDAERMARFQREAQVLALLNHPNIAAIYGLEESGGARALVMELAEGPTLAELLETRNSKFETRRLASSPATSSDFRSSSLDPLQIAKQITEGLEYAHERGVIHRDLKPANVKVRPDGMVKILDFGLAKALDPSDSTSGFSQSDSPTLSIAATQAGVILGTAAYMSPEQARGKPVDKRADIWTFGVVLHEMLTGRQLFAGETVSDTLAAVITKDPNSESLPPDTPPPIRQLLRRCLTKEPKQRLRDIGEARVAIEETLSGAGDVAAASPGRPPAPARPQGSPLQRALPWALVVILMLCAAGVGVWSWLAPPEAAAPAALAYIPPPLGTSYRSYGFSAGPVAVSPDGKNLAFSAVDQKGVTKIWVRPLSSGEAKALAGTEDGGEPFWSPDGLSLGFFADEKLKTVAVRNGTVKILIDAFCGAGRGAWSSEGSILFVPQCGGPIAAIPATGGAARPVVDPGSKTSDVGSSVFSGSPSPLPGGDKFLHVSYAKDDSPSIRMASLATGKSELVLSGADSPQFASGHLLFLRDGKVFAQRFDPGSGKLRSEAMPLAEAQVFSASSNGALAIQGGKSDARLEWFDRNGNSLGGVGEAGLWLAPKLSPDGKRALAVSKGSQANSADLWSYPANGGLGTRLTFGPGWKGFSVWSPDGKYVAYSCSPGGTVSICRKPADGSGAEEPLLKLGPEVLAAYVIDWSPDGRYLSFDQLTGKDLRYSDWVLPLDGSQKPFQPAPVNANQYDGNFSPDGHWLAYFSFETGRPEVFVVPFPLSGGKFQISQVGGWTLRWAANDKLYFLSMGNRLMEANLATSGQSLQVQSLAPLFQLTLPTTNAPLFDVTRDGSRFMVAASADPNASQSITLILNWEAELKSNDASSRN